MTQLQWNATLKTNKNKKNEQRKVIKKKRNEKKSNRWKCRFGFGDCISSHRNRMWKAIVKTIYEGCFMATLLPVLTLKTAPHIYMHFARWSRRWSANTSSHRMRNERKNSNLKRTHLGLESVGEHTNRARHTSFGRTNVKCVKKKLRVKIANLCYVIWILFDVSPPPSSYSPSLFHFSFLLFRPCVVALNSVDTHGVHPKQQRKKFKEFWRRRRRCANRNWLSKEKPENGKWKQNAIRSTFDEFVKLTGPTLWVGVRCQ